MDDDFDDDFEDEIEDEEDEEDDDDDDIIDSDEDDKDEEKKILKKKISKYEVAHIIGKTAQYIAENGFVYLEKNRYINPIDIAKEQYNEGNFIFMIGRKQFINNSYATIVVDPEKLVRFPLLL